MNKIILTNEVKKIIEILINNGYEAYAVGGAIRDALMGVVPNDFDITTSATPMEVKKLFKNTIDTGIKHGTVTVRMNKKSFEVTTYRIDGKYDDNRHPTMVQFTSNLYEDLKRRDFTINALAYNDIDGLIDMCDGRRDMELKVIRCVGDPLCRFDEDALRVLRAIRFVAKTGFRLDVNTALAIRKKAHLLKNISAERIRQELSGIITSKRPESLLLAYELGVTAVILPELDDMINTKQNNPHHFTDVGSHSLISMKYVPQNLILRYTMLIHDMGKPFTRTTDAKGIDHFKTHCEESAKIATKILYRLKFDNETIKKVVKLVRYHDNRIYPDKKFIRKLSAKIQDDMPLMFAVQKADLMAHNNSNLEEDLKRFDQSYEMYMEILRDNEALKISDLKIDGNILISMGVKKGRKIGLILNELLNMVIDEPSLNDEEILKEIVKKIMHLF